jgi:4-phytase/acid phosphatase
MKNLALVMFIVFSMGLLLSCAVAAEDQFSLIKVVLVSRHGVRSPTKSNAALAEYSHHEWPEWSVAPGELTPHGVQLTQTMGHYFRTLYGAQGLFPVEGCPRAETVRVWADNADQRTRASGDALLAGMFPRCKLQADYRRPTENKDPLFHSTQTGVCPLDIDAARQSIMEHAGGSISSVASHYQKQLTAMQGILDYQPARGCSDGREACSLNILPTVLKVDSTGRDIKLDGPLSIASTVSEIFLLEYAEGFSAENIGWGKAAVPSQLAELMSLHNLQSDLLGKAKYIASRRATLLVAQVISALNRGIRHDNEDAQKLVAFIGHDTNLANISGMLDLDWHIDGQPDNTAPGATIAFELLQNKHSGQYVVRTFLYVQSLEQMHKLSPLDLEHPPIRIALVIPGCDSTNICSMERFTAAVERTLDKDCLARAKH